MAGDRHTRKLPKAASEVKAPSKDMMNSRNSVKPNQFDYSALYFLNRRKAKLNMAAGGKSRKKDQKFVFNVGGVRHETYRNTLYSVPNTRLYSIAKKNPRDAEEFDAESREFFFDRHPGAFEQIINFYRTGKLHCPLDICGPMFEEELRYWGIEEKLIEPCCWMNYIKHRDAEASMNLFEGNGLGSANSTDDEADDLELSTTAAKFGMSETKRRTKTKWERMKPKVWRLIDDPYSSCCANIITLVSMTFIVVSIIGFCLETHRWGRVEIEPNPDSTTNSPIQNKTTEYSFLDQFSTTQGAQDHILDYPDYPEYYMQPMGGLPSIPRKETVPKRYLTILDYVCSIWFTFEFIVRLIFCPNRVVFFKTMLNLIDLLAIVPFYVQILADKTDFVVSMWQVIKILRIFRVFKLCRHVIGLKVLVHTLRASAKELILLIVFLVMGVVIFSSLLHYAEFNNLSPEYQTISEFDSIPGGFWWAVITMTTIGYGDHVPQTLFGRFVGALCAICGVLTISLPVPVIVNNFTLYYNHAQARLKLPKKRRIDKLAGAAEALKYSKNDDPNAQVPNVQILRGITNEESTIDDVDSDLDKGLFQFHRLDSSGLAAKQDSVTTRSDWEPMSPDSRINTSISVESLRGYRKRSARNKKFGRSGGVKDQDKEEGFKAGDSIFITTFSDGDNSEIELHDDLDLETNPRISCNSNNNWPNTQLQSCNPTNDVNEQETDQRSVTANSNANGPVHSSTLLYTPNNNNTNINSNNNRNITKNNNNNNRGINSPQLPSPASAPKNSQMGVKKPNASPTRRGDGSSRSMVDMSFMLQKTKSTSSDSNKESLNPTYLSHPVPSRNTLSLISPPTLRSSERRNSFIPRFSQIDLHGDTIDDDFVCVDESSDPNRHDSETPHSPPLPRTHPPPSEPLDSLPGNQRGPGVSVEGRNKLAGSNGGLSRGQASKVPEFSFRVQNSDDSSPDNDITTTDEVYYPGNKQRNFSQPGPPPTFSFSSIDK